MIQMTHYDSNDSLWFKWLTLDDSLLIRFDDSYDRNCHTRFRWLIPFFCNMWHSFFLHIVQLTSRVFRWLTPTHCATWLLHVRDTTPSNVWQSFMHIVHMTSRGSKMTRSHSLCDVTPACVWQNSFICGTQPLQMCAIWLVHISTWPHVGLDDSLILSVTVRDTTPSYVWHDSFILGTGWHSFYI